jgi:hypothetical protein
MKIKLTLLGIGTLIVLGTSVFYRVRKSQTL